MSPRALLKSKDILMESSKRSLSRGLEQLSFKECSRLRSN